METEAVLWRRLDAPGHDACRLLRHGGGWRLEGAAVFRCEDGPAALAYEVSCDAAWLTREGAVRGWVGARPILHRIERSPDGTWTWNGTEAPVLAGCLDLDLGFTPSTNLLSVRRAALAVGEAAEGWAAWLDAPGGAVERLRQRYERRAADGYQYEAPRFGYAGLLQVRPSGFVTKYPGLWEAEP
jgi:hypothetical protein